MPNLVPLKARVRELLDADARRDERARRSMYAHFVRCGDLCFDVGANVGNRVGVFRALGARVVAVEPQPALASYLRSRYPRGVTIVEAGAGAEPGTAELRLATSHTVATMAPEFVAMAGAEGRFEGNEWTDRIVVQVVTLDDLIRQHGEPAFVKIDVEGFEPEVLRGLSRPVAALSFEFTRSLADHASACVDRLAELGRYEFNFSEGETMTWALPSWLPADRIVDAAADAGDWGDVYARYQPSAR